MTKAILARGLSKSFDGGATFALRDISLEVSPGEFVAVIGLSGAGKSTLFRAINGSVTGTGGALEVFGQNPLLLGPAGLVRLRRRIGFVFQQFNLVKNLTVLQNVLTGRVSYTPLWRVLTGFFSASDRALAKKAIDSVGLDGRYHEKARNLSGGQQQRVAIARALVQEPQLLLADEPMASLDPKRSEQVLEMLREINQSQGITVLVNIHVLSLARKYAQRIIGLREGRVVFDGPPSALTEQKVTEIYGEDRP